MDKAKTEGRNRKEVESYAKFHYDPKIEAIVIPKSKLEELKKWRQEFYNLKLIGSDQKGTGFGNVSMRLEEGSNDFIITATRTGGLPSLTEKDFVVVTDFNYQENLAFIKREKGSNAEPSSETPTHHRFYIEQQRINGVIHVHNKAFWEHLLHKDKVPATAEGVEYGTVAMAMEISRLLKDPSVWKRQMIVMAGHEGGIISFGTSLDEAGTVLMKEFGRFKQRA
jgi:hypothetical protein